MWRDPRFRVHPPVGKDGYEVVGRHGVGYRDGELDYVIVLSFLSGIVLAQKKSIVEQNVIPITVFNHNPKAFSHAVYIVVPLERRRDN